MPFKQVPIFLSYERADRESARRLYQALDSRLFQVFFDREWLLAGRDWATDLERLLATAEVLVVLVGKKTAESAYVRREIELFLGPGSGQGVDRPVVPVLVAAGAAIPSPLERFQWLDFVSADDIAALRPLNVAIFEAVYGPFGRSHSRQQPEAIDAGDPESPRENMQRRWEQGEIALSPEALSDMTNLGVLQHAGQCTHLEYDPASPTESRRCDGESVIACVACQQGACGDAMHLYSRFCTVGPDEVTYLNPGTKFFYWCDTCQGPVCTRCLDIAEDYPCPVEDVPSYRFLCPGCRALVRAVVNFKVDPDGIRDRLVAWARSGGPPLAERPEGGGASWRAFLGRLHAGAAESLREADERGDAGAAHELGTLLMTRGDTEAAIEAFRRAEERGDHSAPGHLGIMLFEREEVTAAEAPLRRGVTHGDTAAALVLGMILNDRGDLEGAQAMLEFADTSGMPLAALHLGGLLLRRGWRDAAAEPLRRAAASEDTEIARAAATQLKELESL